MQADGHLAYLFYEMKIDVLLMITAVHGCFCHMSCSDAECCVVSGSGSGQGLFKTPDDPPADPKAQAPAQAGPLSMLSPWNTPALAQPAPPNPPDSTQCWKLAGMSFCLLCCAAECHIDVLP